MHRTRLFVAATLAVVLTAGLASCAPGDREATPDASETPVAPLPTPSGEAQAAFDPDANATVNKPLFDAINKAVIEKSGSRTGKKFTVALAAAGFPLDRMELTPDRTAVDLAADSVIFSVQIGEECLIGQYGVKGYDSTIAPMLGSSKCLIGVTRKIDW